MATETKGGTRELRLFLVDDDLVALDLYTKALRKSGYFTMAAACAADALEIIDRGLTKADVIITDINMPELNGLELYQIVKKRHPELARKIIFITGGIFDEKLEAFARNLPNPKLDKPVKIERLLQAIVLAADLPPEKML
jgi:two-component system NtrC family sensor kinase